MKLFDTITAMLDLKAAEIRTGITLVEAVALDAQLADLSKVGDPAELLAIAVEAGKLGLTVDDIGPMAHLWYLTRALGLTESEIRGTYSITQRHQKGDRAHE